MDSPKVETVNLDNDERCVVTREEVVKVFRLRLPGNSAPSPEAKILKKIPDELLDKINEIFTACLKEGIFPRMEKSETRANIKGRLVGGWTSKG